MEIVTVAVGGLATWRVTHAIVKENGPLMVFARIRAYLAARQTRSGGLFDMISCTSCFSVWTGLTAALFVSHDMLQWLFYGFSFSAVSMILERFFTK